MPKLDAIDKTLVFGICKSCLYHGVKEEKIHKEVQTAYSKVKEDKDAKDEVLNI